MPPVYCGIDDTRKGSFGHSIIGWLDSVDFRGQIWATAVESIRFFYTQPKHFKKKT